MEPLGTALSFFSSESSVTFTRKKIPKEETAQDAGTMLRGRLPMV